MRKRASSEKGTSLIETAIALGVLTFGALGVAGLFTQGMEKTKSSPGDLIATQKAQEAIESVFSARDSKNLTWAQLRNVQGGSGSDNGVFLDGARGVKEPGSDGLVNTSDDGAVETVAYPGRDLLIGTGDDVIVRLDGFTREIRIRDIQTGLRSITVTVTYQSGSESRTYTLTTYISNYA